MYLERANNATWKLNRTPSGQATKAMLGKQQTSNNPMLLLAIFKLKKIMGLFTNAGSQGGYWEFPRAAGSWELPHVNARNRRLLQNSACF